MTNKEATAISTPIGMALLSCRDKLQADGRIYLKFLARRRKPARSGVDAEDDDVIRHLVGREQEIACGIDVKVARHYSAAEHLFHRRQRAVFGINRETAKGLRSATGLALGTAI